MTSILDSGTRILANPQHVQSALRDEAVVLQFGSGEYFGLNAVGVRVWELVQTERSFGELVAIVVAEYEVAPAVAAEDLSAMVLDLQRYGLVELNDFEIGGDMLHDGA